MHHSNLGTSTDFQTFLQLEEQVCYSIPDSIVESDYDNELVHNCYRFQLVFIQTLTFLHGSENMLNPIWILTDRSLK